MFNWLTNCVNNARIAFTYPSYERECREQWVAIVERTYSTVQIEQDIEARMAEPMRHVSSTYDMPISELESRRENILKVVADAKRKLAILERDYKAELDAAYKTLNETREEFDECRRRLSIAHDNLNLAKHKLDS